MSDDNPFAVTSGSLDDSRRDYDVTTAEVTTRTIELLSQTRPWVLLLGVLLWIGTVFLAIACVFAGGLGLITQNPTFLLMAVVYVLMTLVYGALARALTTCASKISQLVVSEKVRDLEDALEAQKTFWRLIGIITLVGIIIYVMVLIVMLSGMFMMGNMMQR